MIQRAAGASIEARRDEPPRLILRFAVSLCIALACAAGAILLVVRHYNTIQAERAATSQARVVAATLLRGSLAESDFERVGAERRRALDEFFQRALLADGFVRVDLHAPNGSLTYSTDRRSALDADAPSHVREALGGVIRGDVTMVRGGDGDRRVLRTYAPVRLRETTGVVALFQDYAPIQAAANATFLPVVGIFEIVLISLFGALVPILRRVVRRIRRQMAEIEYRALYDDLSGLPNRTFFRDRVEEALQGTSAAVMLLDLDHFKEINDALGHRSGDFLLGEVGERLRARVRDDAFVARLGGDEFAILLPGATLDDALATASHVHAALEIPFTFDGLPLEIAASIGISQFPEHGSDVDTLLRRADVAMYLAKHAHAGTAAYDPEQDTSDADRLALAAELRRAIEDEQLVLYYQPKASLETGVVAGVEALVRWEHPERGLVAPNDFIPVAERTGLIKPLTRYVLAAALRQCRAWADDGSDLQVAVNVTIPDLLDVELPDYIDLLLRETRVRPDQLELELTESTILADPFRVRQVLARFDEMGIGLAIDDFGTGYSSFAYLKRLPVKTIKIDRSFVMGMCEDESDATIVHSTIDLARNLGLEVVAEGVESQAIWDALRARGCSLAQGYFISRPIPAADLSRLLEERAASRTVTAALVG